MSVDIRFIQKYNEILLENFNAVLKQNLMFQTQIGVLEEDVKRHDDYEIIKKDVVNLMRENSELRSELNGKNNIINNNLNTDTERHRLQSALNNQSKELSVLTEKVAEQTEYIKQLEDMLPNSKKKKLGIIVADEMVTLNANTLIEVPNDKNDIVKAESAGGNF